MPARCWPSTSVFPPVVCVLAGALVAVVASVLLALSALRVSGDYLLIASLGFQLGLLQVIKNFEFTGGPGGLSAIPSTITGAVAHAGLSRDLRWRGGADRLAHRAHRAWALRPRDHRDARRGAGILRARP